MARSLLLQLLFILCLGFAWAGNDVPLQTLLDVDRFHAYLMRWSQHMEGQGKKDIAQAMRGVTPADIEKLGVNLSDAFDYDKVIHQLLIRNKNFAALKKGDVEWNYNFYKRKLNDAYVVDKPSNGKPVKAAVIDTEIKGKLQSVEAIDPEDVLLNVDGYVSGRTTRGVFWEASRSQRTIELHVGTAGDFKADLAARGAKILGQVKTVERNYNPIYLIQLPGEETYRYAVTEISGADRVKHFTMQSQLVSWRDKNSARKAPPIELFGDPAAQLLREEKALTQVLEGLPKADHVLIGQKGAFERTIGAMGKASALRRFMEVKGFEKDVSPQHQKVLLKLKADPNLAMKGPGQLTAVEKTYEELKPLLERKNVPLARSTALFDLDRGSYEMSDFILNGEDGKPQRWRVFSNSWGDEVVPIGRALKATGHTDVDYIGTAGAFTNSDAKVGDLVIPKNAVGQDGTKFAVKHSGLVPKGAKTVDAVANVSSPLEETNDWLGRTMKSSQVVEIETSYLAEIFNGADDNFSPYLLISDVVGVEGESLAEASSSTRRNAQHAILTSILDETNVTGPVSSSLSDGDKLQQWIDELAPNRDPVSRFQVLREAQERAISTKAEFAAFLEKQPGFTTARLETSLKEAGRRFEALIGEMIPGKVSIDRRFLEGRYNPAGKEPIRVHIQVSSPKAEEDLMKIIAEARKSDKKFQTFLDVQVTRGPPEKTFIRLEKLPESGVETFLDLYKDSAMGFGGLAATETRTGNLKFVQVAPGTTGRAVPTVAFFAPDEETEGALKALKSASGESFLKKEIKEMNKFAGAHDPWEIKYTVVDDLIGDSLAQIVPEISGDATNLTINLRITKKGLKNPAVVMEELIHLQQITGAPVPWKPKTNFKAFVHPFHWAEVVANARAGSLNASEKLARLEIEAANASSDAVKYYRKAGLWDKADAAAIDTYLETRAAHAEELYLDVATQAKAQNKVKAAAWERAKNVFEKLETQTVKLNDLVAKGDRKGVRKLVETYLPWDLMEPSEMKSWKDWLDAIEKPNKQNAKLVFRGMYDDFVFRTADDKPFLMSTVLTKNQGNYTRRLRSLGTMREKFGPRQLGAFVIDERRLILNALSPDKYLYQHEMLTPLFIFPDEVVHFHDYARNPVEGVGPKSPEVRKKHFIGELEKKLGRKVTKVELSGLGSEQDFMKASYRKLKEMILEKEELPKVGVPCAIGKGKGGSALFTSLNELLK